MEDDNLKTNEFSIRVDIIHSRKISHKQNIAHAKPLGIDLTPLDEIDVESKPNRQPEVSI
jgi:hypothetical protein